MLLAATAPEGVGTANHVPWRGQQRCRASDVFRRSDNVVRYTASSPLSVQRSKSPGWTRRYRQSRSRVRKSIRCVCLNTKLLMTDKVSLGRDDIGYTVVS